MIFIAYIDVMCIKWRKKRKSYIRYYV